MASHRVHFCIFLSKNTHPQIRLCYRKTFGSLKHVLVLALLTAFDWENYILILKFVPLQRYCLLCLSRLTFVGRIYSKWNDLVLVSAGGVWLRPKVQLNIIFLLILFFHFLILSLVCVLSYTHHLAHDCVYHRSTTNIRDAALVLTRLNHSKNEGC